MKSKKIISFILVLAVLLSVVTISVSAASGSCGDNLTWEFDSLRGTLTITGTGTMKDYSSKSAPWYDHRGGIYTVIIGYGVKNIGNNAFYGCSSLTSVTMPNSVTSIGSYAFEGCTNLKKIGNVEGTIAIPNSVVTIGYGAFEGCEAATGIVIPSSVESIAVRAFHDMYNVTSLEYNAVSIKSFSSYGAFDSLGKDGAGVTVTIGADVQIIPENFSAKNSNNVGYYYPKFTKVIFKGTKVKTIGYRAFDLGYGDNSQPNTGYIETLKTVVFCGTSDQWNSITIGTYNKPLINATKKYHTTHNYGTKTTIVEPTCTSAGQYKAVCLDCNEVTYGTLSALGHNWGVWQTLKTPTCTDTGSEKHICLRCDKEETQTIAALGHELVHHDAKVAKCEEAGNIEYWQCTRCGKYYSDAKATREITLTGTVIRALGHSYEGSYNDEAHPHPEYQLCSRCGEKEYTGNSKQIPGCSECCPVTGIALDKSEVSLIVGKTVTLTAIVSPSDAANKSVTWSSSNTSVATVSSNGVVTAKATGTATITVTTADGGKTATCVVTVEEEQHIPTDAPRFVIGKVQGRAGSTVKVPVSIENNPGMWGMDLIISYDRTVMTLTNVINGTVFSEAEWTQGDLSKETYILSYENADFTNNTNNGVIATLEFFINADTDSGEYFVNAGYTPGSVIDVDFNDLDLAIETGSVIVVAFVYGDINDDGSINKKDSLLLKKYLAGYDVEINELAADVYTDGSVNKKDSLLLKKYLAGWDVDLGQSVIISDSIYSANSFEMMDASLTPTIKLDEMNGKAGDQVPINVVVDGNPGIWGIDLVISYDNSNLKLESVTNGEVFAKSEWTEGDLSKSTYILSYEASGFEDITNNGVLATLNFKVLDTAEDGTYSINASYRPGDIINVDFEDIDFAITNGKIIVSSSHTHTLEYVPAAYATCTTDGNTEYWHCQDCDKYYSDADAANEITLADTVIAALGHDYVATVTAPTCTEQGYTAHTCSRCDDSYVDTYIEALGHDFGEWTVTKGSTCTEGGTERHDCSRCDAYETREIAALGHDYIHHDAKAPTCTEIGWEAYDTCSRCDYTTYVELAALGHDYIHHDAKAPTCTEIGWEAYDTCSRCDYTTYVELAALGHDYVAVVTATTCTEQGYTTHTCSRCDDSYVDTYVDAPGHDFGEWTVTKGSTCTEGGTERRDCSRCDEYETREIAALGHDYVATVTDPTCIEQGYTTHACSRCDDSYVDTYVDALGHDFGAWTVTKGSTCTEGGTERCDCSRCDAYETREIAALGHTEEVMPAVAPKCEETGLTEGKKCSVCGEILAAQEVIPSTGHTPKTLAAVEPTCENHGLTQGSQCSVCNKILVAQNVIPALGHVRRIRNESVVYTGDVYCWRCGKLLEKGKYRPFRPVIPRPFIPSQPDDNKPVVDELPFTDVTKDAPYYDAVAYLYEVGLMKGTSETEFSPEYTLNRATVVTVLYRLEGEPEVEDAATFTDVDPDGWYSKAVAWAASVGIVKGYGDGTFGPKKDVTNEQLAAIIVRYADYKGLEIAEMTELPEGTNVSDWAVADVAWAANEGILGVAQATDAKSYANRAEVAVAIYTYIVKVGK